MRVRISLFGQILFWFFLNVVVLAGVLFGIFNLQFRLPKDSPWFLGNRLDFVAARIGEEMRAGGDRQALLARFSAAYHVDFLLFSGNGQRLAGPALDLPLEVGRYVSGPVPAPHEGRRSPGPLHDVRGGGAPPPRARPVFSVRTANPTRYWGGVRLPVFEAGRERPDLATLLAVSDSMSGHGLFFDVRPWLLLAALVLGLSIALWVPFVRSLTGRVRQMTFATEQIAQERFDARVEERRSDELGRLGTAINQLAGRLSRFVGGQKRFLGDIAHELNSPLGRLEVALSILEERVGEEQQAYVADAQEEVRSMSRLVSELLAFSRAGMTRRELPLAPVLLLPLVEEVRQREACGREVQVQVDEQVTVLAHRELLGRALANLLRNAARYAADSGPVQVTASREAGEVLLRVADRGPGVPADALPRLFDPFFRLEPDRARSTGGTGLGLAIVKTCVEACQGRVSAQNLDPHGFEVSIRLRAA